MWTLLSLYVEPAIALFKLYGMPFVYSCILYGIFWLVSLLTGWKWLFDILVWIFFFCCSYYSAWKDVDPRQRFPWEFEDDDDFLFK